ncbi:hypothetical protein [Kushneria aurantia]|uniref:Uncharacterized protein n=1 Tax=Kushneria aurantia TaxID=504092 RepID=A0ABV6G2Z5_9GAMM|nr:hypothetical protein [Kushneria aurantia]
MKVQACIDYDEQLSQCHAIVWVDAADLSQASSGMSAAEGSQIVAAILGVWALAWVARAVGKAFNIR